MNKEGDLIPRVCKKIRSGAIVNKSELGKVQPKISGKWRVRSSAKSDWDSSGDPERQTTKNK